LSSSPFPVSSCRIISISCSPFFYPDGRLSVQYPPQKGQQFVRIIQGIINDPAGTPPAAGCWFFHFPHGPLLLAGLAILSLLPFLLFRGAGLPVSITRSFWLALLVFSFVNFLLYPAILQYQAGTQAGEWIDRSGIISAVYLLQEAPVNYSIEFDSPAPVRRIPDG
jgi:hypothetical protein